MIDLKVIAISKSGKSALVAAQIPSGPFVSEVTGNVTITEAVEVGKVYPTTFTAVQPITRISKDNKAFVWLALS